MANTHAIPTKSFNGLPDYGGEGYDNYKGNKSDMNLNQIGGEGSKTLGTKSDAKLPQIGGEQC